MNSKEKFRADMTNGWKFRLFAISKLPSLIFWGVKLHSFTDEKCTTSINYGWSNTNPFKSMYFATMIGAAELSTRHVYHTWRRQDVYVSRQCRR
ncbi:MAG TPA: hypothetical protein PKD85_15960 [Saprospiraceae bacterium]|nr:hypothetical protein [Saprospiraceae bacterium]